MDVCAQCGHELGIGRFCVNCGHPVGAPVDTGAPPRGAHAQRAHRPRDWRTDTAERPRVVPPPAAPVPAPPRYPLYADEATATAPQSREADPGTVPGPAAEPTSRPRHVDDSRRSGVAAGWVPWVTGLTAMLLLAGLGLWLLLGDDESPTSGSASGSAGDPARTEQPSRDTRQPEGRATVSPAPPPAEPRDLTGVATVRAPRSAPSTQDVTGSPVSFAAANLLDGVPETCWRMPGDGTGESITFGFDGPTEMSEVGLVNGYAKTASSSSGTYDWYAGNRRTLRVEWTFDDGTVVTQDLAETREMQTVTLDDGVVTEQVTLRLIEVTPPGVGEASRDYTAISGVRLLGAPT